MRMDQAIWWQIYPLGALGAPLHGSKPSGTVVHRLRLLENWLGYVADLGATGLLLGPIFQSRRHGYDTLDHFRIDERLGDNSDFDRLVKKAADYGLEIMLDGVFNHVSVEHELVTSTFAKQNFSPDAPIKIAWSNGKPFPYLWEAKTGLAELNHSCDQVKQLVIDAMKFWLDRGASGWRLDVAYCLPTDFLAETISTVRQTYPEAIFLGEVIHGDYAKILSCAHLDSVTQYELWKAIWSSIHDKNMWELAHALDRHQEMSQAGVMQTFVGNHDVDRVASIIGPEAAGLAAAILFTLPGMPSVYYGDEQGFEGLRGTGDGADDPVRPQLPDSPNSLFTPSPWLFSHYQKLIEFRKTYSWLTYADVHVCDKENEWIEYECINGGNALRIKIDVDQLSILVSHQSTTIYQWQPNL